MGRNILMLTSTWDHDCLIALINGIRDRLSNENRELHVFNAYDDIYDKCFYLKDKEIFELPNPDAYAGVILSLTSVDASGAVKDVVAKLREKSIPIICVDQHIENVSFVGLDNYKSEYAIVEHMIVEHGCRTFNYVGGPANNEENKERYRAFLDCLNAHQIPFDYKRAKHYRFSHRDGETAYREFKRDNNHIPDAVICANDFMAIGYCNAAKSDGFSVPDDFKIAGFDNVKGGQNFFPSITSINRNFEQLGFDAAEGILYMIENGENTMKHYTVGSIKLNESCGCDKKRDIKSDYRVLINNFTAERSMNSRLGSCRQLLGSCFNIEQMKDAMYRCEQLLGISNIAVVVNENLLDTKSEEIIGYTDRLTAYMEDSEESIIREKDLVPNAVRNTSNVYVFGALHFGKQTFGYSVMAFEESFMTHAFHRAFMESYSLALANIKQRMVMDIMNKRLRELYVMDGMTGLYNRYGYMENAQKYFDKYEGCVSIVCFDVDNLKVINDKFGHAMGDMAIKGVAAGIKEFFDDSSIRIRMGGDEFLVISEFCENEDLELKKSRILEYLKDYSIANKLPFSLGASIGYVSNNGMDAEMTLGILMQLGDQQLYAVKAKRHESAGQENCLNIKY